VPLPDENLALVIDVHLGVAATSASNAWAVGYRYDGTAYKTLALHCC
jgi:hypothetical protein